MARRYALQPHKKLATAHAVFQRAKRRGCLPSRRAKALRERSDAQWLSIQKIAKRGHSTLAWHPILAKIAKEYGFPHAFRLIDRREQLARMARRVFQRARRGGSLPLLHRKGASAQEVKDARWLDQRKYGALVRQIAQEYGFAEALRVSTRGVGGAITQAHAVFSRAKKRGMLPIRKQANYGDQEYTDAAWINTKKSAKAGIGGCTWYPVLDEIAAQHGFPDAFCRRQKGDVATTFYEKRHAVKTESSQLGS